MIRLFAAFIADIFFGDPYWLYHPIRLIGKWISFLERRLRKYFPPSDKGERTAGRWLVPLTVLPSFILPFVILEALTWWRLPLPDILLRFTGPVKTWGEGLAMALDAFWMYQILAMGCLKKEALKVYGALKENDLSDARKKLSWLVGRDTQDLSKEEVVKATVETVAENTTDGVASPLFYMALGLIFLPFGAPLGFAYKAVNTLDSMVGYRNERYKWFGRASAITDDVANFIPARLCGLSMVVAAFFGYDGRGAWKVFKRDRLAHLSPNSAQTESACAGALGIQLGGTHDYFGKPVEKPTLGDPARKAEKKHIKDSLRLMYRSGWLCLMLAEFMALAGRFAQNLL